MYLTGDDNKKDAKDEKMEALLRKVDADFLAMIKEAEDDESKVATITMTYLNTCLPIYYVPTQSSH